VGLWSAQTPLAATDLYHAAARNVERMSGVRECGLFEVEPFVHDIGGRQRQPSEKWGLAMGQQVTELFSFNAPT
jgi:hypothetical protein